MKILVLAPVTAGARSVLLRNSIGTEGGIFIFDRDFLGMTIIKTENRWKN